MNTATDEDADACIDACIAEFGFVYGGMVERRLEKTVGYLDVYRAIERAISRCGLTRSVCHLVTDHGGVVLKASVDDDPLRSAYKDTEVAVYVSRSGARVEWFIGRVTWAVGQSAIHMSNRWG